MEPSRNPKFSTPPIIEIGISILFTRPVFLTAAHLGRFWESVASEFPRAEDHSPSGLPTEWGNTPEGLPLPRLWLIDAEGAILMQLQVNRFDLNWRRISENDTYPSFHAQLEKLMVLWGKFVSFLKKHSDEAVLIRGAEVFKISHILEGGAWHHWSDITKVIPALSLTNIGDSWDIEGFSTVFEMSKEDGKVRADIKLGRVATRPSQKAIGFEIRALATNIASTSDEPGNLVERISAANEMANLAFTSLVAPDVQVHFWGRKS